jgi:hypothetical protein
MRRGAQDYSCSGLHGLRTGLIGSGLWRSGRRRHGSRLAGLRFRLRQFLLRLGRSVTRLPRGGRRLRLHFLSLLFFGRRSFRCSAGLRDGRLYSLRLCLRRFLLRLSGSRSASGRCSAIRVRGVRLRLLWLLFRLGRGGFVGVWLSSLRGFLFPLRGCRSVRRSAWLRGGGLCGVRLRLRYAFRASSPQVWPPLASPPSWPRCFR